MPSEKLVNQVHEVFTRFRIQANSDGDALTAMVDLIAYLGSGSQPRQESKVFLNSCGWWPMGQEIFWILRDNVIFYDGNIVWRGETTDGQARVDA